jgi:hypothetical protein
MTTNVLVLGVLGFCFPVVIVMISGLFVYQVTSYMGRVAYHGMLLSDKVADQTEELDSAETGGLARMAEELLCKSFYQTSETKDDDKVLDSYLIATLPPSGRNTFLEKVKRDKISSNEEKDKF